MRPQGLRTRPRMLFARSKPLFSVKDGAAYLGLAETTLRRQIAAGRLPVYPWGRRHLLRRDDLDSFFCLLQQDAGCFLQRGAGHTACRGIVHE